MFNLSGAPKNVKNDWRSFSVLLLFRLSLFGLIAPWACYSFGVSNVALQPDAYCLTACGQKPLHPGAYCSSTYGQTISVSGSWVF